MLIRGKDLRNNSTSTCYFCSDFLSFSLSWILTVKNLCFLSCIFCDLFSLPWCIILNRKLSKSRALLVLFFKNSFYTLWCGIQVLEFVKLFFNEFCETSNTCCIQSIVHVCNWQLRIRLLIPVCCYFMTGDLLLLLCLFQFVATSWLETYYYFFAKPQRFLHS